MTDVLSSRVGKRECNATRVAFLIAGFGMAAWAPLVPIVKTRASLSEGELGMLLLLVGAGSVLAMPLAGQLSSRLGCRLPITLGACLIAVALPVLSFSDNVLLLGAALFVSGAGLGTVEVVANLQAILVEKAFSRAMMSGFHGMWSVGGILGALSASALLWLGATPTIAMAVISALIVGLVVICGAGLLPFAGEKPPQVSAFPKGIVLVLGGLNFLVFLAEGSVLDWGAVFLSANLNTAPAYSALGYSAFAVAMTLCRLRGDRVVEALGGRRVVLYGGLLGAFGFAIIVSAPYTWLAVLGFFLVGVGSSNIAPILISMAGRQTHMATHAAVASMTAIGYSGVVVGPALIGLLAEFYSLQAAFIAISLLFLVLAMGSRLIR